MSRHHFIIIVLLAITIYYIGILHGEVLALAVKKKPPQLPIIDCEAEEIIESAV